MKFKMNQLLIIVLVAGFLFGTFYVSNMGIRGKMFDTSVLKVLGIYEIDYKEYLLYIIKERVGVLLLVLFLSNVRWKRIYGGILTFIVGIASGAVLAMAVGQSEIKGGILCIMCVLPHGMFYGMAYVILVNYWMNNGRWNWSKTGGVVIFIILGILSETFIGSSLVKMIIK